MRLDVTSEADWDAAVKAATDAHGGLDILVNNAGVFLGRDIEEVSLDDWHRLVSVNLTGVFLCARAAAEQMAIAGNGGLIINISSISRAGNMGQSNYSAAKAGVAAMTVTWAKEFNRYGIRVNTVNPDAVLRGSKIWTGEWKEQRAAAYKMDTDELEAHYRDRSMLKRSVFPEDIAEAIYFLASDMSAKSTGNIINVDAGNAQSFTR